MRKLLILIALISPPLRLAAGVAPSCDKSGEVCALLDSLDYALQRKEIYRQTQEERIDHLRQMLAAVRSDVDQQYYTQSRLAERYTAFQFDSALHYLSLNLDLARRMNWRHRYDETLLESAFLYTTAGFYLEASNLLAQLDTLALSDRLLGRYYTVRRRFCRESYEYARSTDLKRKLLSQRGYYTYKVMTSYPQDSDEFLFLLSEDQIENGHFEVADEAVNTLLQRVVPTERNYAICCYIKALISLYRGETGNYVLWLTRSAITDAQEAISDNASLSLLSRYFFEQGDIVRAFRYMQASMNDANFYNARLRPWQISNALTVIEDAYRIRQRRQHRIELVYIGVISLLFLVVGVVALIEIRQKRRISRMKEELQTANGRLNDYVARLSEINDRQLRLTGEIREANAVKEEYIALFLKACSEYIDRINEYRRAMRRKLTSGAVQEVARELKSTAMIDQYVDDFYRTFDTAFLKIYPDFVEKFNALLVEEGRIELKRGERLNTELRIFALIRLGIVDSSKIAALLRCSVNTIYSYRAKIKNNASVPREQFEECVRSIGAFLQDA